MKALSSALLSLGLVLVLIGCEEVNLGVGAGQVAAPPADDSSTVAEEPVAPSESVDPGDGSATLTPAEVAACPVAPGKKITIIRVVGDHPHKEISTSDTVALIVSGNRSSYELHLKASPDGKPVGLCVYARGNEGHVEVESDAKIGSFLYQARGNENSLELEAEDGSSLAKGKVDLNGNQNHAEIEYDRDAQVVCPDVVKAGNDNTVECGQEQEEHHGSFAGFGHFGHH